MDTAIVTAPEAIESVLFAWDAIKAGQILLIVSSLVTLLTQLSKTKAGLSLYHKLPDWGQTLFPLVLGAIGAATASIAAGIPWPEAVLLAVTAGPLAGTIFDLVSKLKKTDA